MLEKYKILDLKMYIHINLINYMCIHIHCISHIHTHHILPVYFGYVSSCRMYMNYHTQTFLVLESGCCPPLPGGEAPLLLEAPSLLTPRPSLRASQPQSSSLRSCPELISSSDSDPVIQGTSHWLLHLSRVGPKPLGA